MDLKYGDTFMDRRDGEIVIFVAMDDDPPSIGWDCLVVTWKYDEVRLVSRDLSQDYWKKLDI